MMQQHCSLGEALQIQSSDCRLMYAERTMSNLDRDLNAWLISCLQSMFLALDNFRDFFFCKADQSVLDLLSSPYMSFSEMLFWLGQGALVFALEVAREPWHSCLFSPHCVKEPLHRCSPKVNEALWFCGSSVFLNEALSWPGLNILRVLISPLFCWFTSAVWFRKWQSHKSIFPFLPQNLDHQRNLTLLLQAISLKE